MNPECEARRKFRVAITRLLLGVALIPSPSCRNSAERIKAGTSYELVSYRGHALPAEILSILELPRQPTGKTVRCAHRVSSMNLRFESPSSFVQTESLVVSCEDGRADIRHSEVTKGTYGRSRGIATFLLPGEFGVLQSTGRFTGETLAVSSQRPVDAATDSTRTTFPLIFIATR